MFCLCILFNVCLVRFIWLFRLINVFCIKNWLLGFVYNMFLLVISFLRLVIGFGLICLIFIFNLVNFEIIGVLVVFVVDMLFVKIFKFVLNSVVVKINFFIIILYFEYFLYRLVYFKKSCIMYEGDVVCVLILIFYLLYVYKFVLLISYYDLILFV